MLINLAYRGLVALWSTRPYYSTVVNLRPKNIVTGKFQERSQSLREQIGETTQTLVGCPQTLVEPSQTLVGPTWAEARQQNNLSSYCR